MAALKLHPALPSTDKAVTTITNILLSVLLKFWDKNPLFDDVIVCKFSDTGDLDVPIPWALLAPTNPLLNKFPPDDVHPVAFILYSTLLSSPALTQLPPNIDELLGSLQTSYLILLSCPKISIWPGLTVVLLGYPLNVFFNLIAFVPWFDKFIVKSKKKVKTLNENIKKGIDVKVGRIR